MHNWCCWFVYSQTVTAATRSQKRLPVSGKRVLIHIRISVTNSHCRVAKPLRLFLLEPNFAIQEVPSGRVRQQLTPTKVTMKCKSHNLDYRVNLSERALTLFSCSPQGWPCCHHHQRKICREEGETIFNPRECISTPDESELSLEPGRNHINIRA